MSLSKSISWDVPQEYIASIEDTRGWRLLVSEAGRFLLHAPILVIVKGIYQLDGWKNWLIGILAAFAYEFILSTLRHFVTCRKPVKIVYGVLLTVKYLSVGTGKIRWNRVNWYQFKDVDGFPPFPGFEGFRALEIEINRGEMAQVVPLVFNPKKVNENEILSFLEEVIPGKRWQH